MPMVKPVERPSGDGQIDTKTLMEYGPRTFLFHPGRHIQHQSQDAGPVDASSPAFPLPIEEHLTLSNGNAMSEENHSSNAHHGSETISTENANGTALTSIGDEDLSENPYAFANGMPSPVTQGCQLDLLLKDTASRDEGTANFPLPHFQFCLPPGQLQFGCCGYGYLGTYNAFGELELGDRATRFFNVAYGSSNRPVIGSPWGFGACRLHPKQQLSVFDADLPSSPQVPSSQRHNSNVEGYSHESHSGPSPTQSAKPGDYQTEYGSDGFVPFSPGPHSKPVSIYCCCSQESPFGAIGEGRPVPREGERGSRAPSRLWSTRQAEYGSLADLVAQSEPMVFLSHHR